MNHEIKSNNNMDQLVDQTWYITNLYTHLKSEPM